MVQQVKDLALPLLWLRSLLWHRFGSWPGNVHMLQARPKKKKKKKRELEHPFQRPCLDPAAFRPLNWT